MMNEINILELFGGICGFSLGLKNAGFKINKLYYSEVDNYARAVTRYNYPDAIQLGDVRGLRGENLEKIDILTFGSPCQDLSIAGARNGLGGARSGLFFEAIRLIRKIRPTIFVWENVKGAFSSNAGRDFLEIIRQFADIGIYECEWQLVNSRWVLPQNRERIYFVGHTRGSRFGKIFPIVEINRGDSQTVQRREKNRGLIKIGTIGHDSVASRVYSEDGCAVALRANGGGGGAKTGLYMTKQNRVRRLTPTECERLQGFPDGWTKNGIDENGGEIKISDTQRYKMVGNAVSVPIIQLIGKKLLVVKN